VCSTHLFTSSQLPELAPYSLAHFTIDHFIIVSFSFTQLAVVFVLKAHQAHRYGPFIIYDCSIDWVAQRDLVYQLDPLVDLNCQFGRLIRPCQSQLFSSQSALGFGFPRPLSIS
jgi:hypothetical protein